MTVVYWVAALWTALVIIAAGWGTHLDHVWPAWAVAFWAAAVWGVNLVLLYYIVGPPFTLSRICLISVVFAFLMTAIGSGSYWATTQLFPLYRVFIERAALFVAICTLASLLGCILVKSLSVSQRRNVRGSYVWDWGRLRVFTCALFSLCLLGTYISIRRIGYIPLLTGDPESLRVAFPAIAGVWLRLSMLGIVVGLLAGAQVCARRGDWVVWMMGGVGLVCASLYGNRFFIALPLGAVVLL